MPQANSSKGNPASKRMGNVRLRDRRAASWRRSQEKKKKTVKAQNERMKKNLEALNELGIGYRNKRPSKMLRKARRAIRFEGR